MSPEPSSAPGLKLGSFRFFAQESIRFAQFTRPFKLGMPLPLELLWLPLWALLAPLLRWRFPWPAIAWTGSTGKNASPSVTKLPRSRAEGVRDDGFVLFRRARLMVIVRLTGGLGNQMFQYAAGRALADRLGAEMLLDTRAFERALAFQAYTRRAYALGPFKLRATAATPADLKNWPLWVVEIGMRLKLVRPLFRRWHFEPAITYDPGVRTLREPVCLVGYWQSERYFIDIADRIRADFKLRQALSDANARLLELARSASSVGLHVRRGDFVSLNDAAQVHGLCAIDYYRRAISLVRKRCPECHFLVFSDDPEWARAELPLDPSAVFVAGNEQRPEQDLALMSTCKHHVIANSSFSWWAGWLGYSPDQIVIAPSPWYASPKLDARDLAVPHWQYISRL